MPKEQEKPKEKPKEKFYISANEKKNKILSEMSDSIKDANQSVQRESSTAGFYTNLEDNISVRPPYSRRSYEKFRPNEAIPSKDSDIMLSCRDSYEKVGLIRSVVDLMSEMAIEGLTIVSTNESMEKFFRSWMKKTKLMEKAEKFANYFIVEGNVAIRRKRGEVDDPEVRRMKRGVQSANTKHSIPVDYVFYDPSTLELIGGEAALFAGIKQWALKVNSIDLNEVRKLVKGSKKRDIIKNLPEEIREIIQSDKPISPITRDLLISIPEDEIYVAHYKKKDSDIWAKSFIYSILHDVIYNEKLRMAKISALDSWYNSVRLWKLGDHKEEILPDVGSINKLANILENHSGGTMDIIWDSMIDYQQYFPPIENLQNFEENYESMLLGLGIHKSLIGGDENPAAAASAFIGLRNVMKRIDAVRRALTMWIEEEIDIISEELGFRTKPIVKYNVDDLFEQSSYFRLLIDLNDRNIISNRTIVEKIGELYEIESERLKTEEKRRGQESTSPKYSPFIQSYIPEQNKEPEIITEPVNTESPNNTDGPPMTNRIGRPPGAKDEKKRRRRFQTIAELVVLGDRVQDNIDTQFDKEYLQNKNIKNKRVLSSRQRSELDQLKIIALSQVDSDNPKDSFSMSDFNFKEYDTDFVESCETVIKAFGKEVSLSEIKSVRSLAFATKRMESE